MLLKLLQNLRTDPYSRAAIKGALIGAVLWPLVFFLLVSCATVPDVAICVELNMSKGFCTNTVSDKDYEIDEKHPAQLPGDDKPKTWWERRPYMILLPASSWKELKAYIIKQCKRTDCDQYIKSWDRKLNALDPGASQ